MNRVSGICGKNQSSCHGFQKSTKGEKKYDWRLLKFGKRFKSSDSRRQVNSKQEILEARDIIIKTESYRQRKNDMEKQPVVFRGTVILTTVNFSWQTIQARRIAHLFELLKEMIVSEDGGEIRAFSHEERLIYNQKSFFKGW